MNIKYKDALEIINHITRKADIANSHARDILGRTSNDNSESGAYYGRGEMSKFTEEGVEFKYVYNISCHCHPQYSTQIYLIPFEWIDAIETKYLIPPEQNIGEGALSEWDNESLDETPLIAILEKTKAEREEAKKRLEEQKRQEEMETSDKIRLECERQEKAEFERLAKKYG